MDMSSLFLVMLEKGISIDKVCEDLNIKRNDFLQYLHGNEEAPKEIRVYLGTHE